MALQAGRLELMHFDLHDWNSRTDMVSERTITTLLVSSDKTLLYLRGHRGRAD